MAEWFKAAVLKTAVRVTPHRGFESPSLRWSDYLMMTVRAKGQNGQASDKVILQALSFGWTATPRAVHFRMFLQKEEYDD